MSYILLLFCFHGKMAPQRPSRQSSFVPLWFEKQRCPQDISATKEKRRSLLVKMNEVEKFFFLRIYTLLCFLGEKIFTSVGVRLTNEAILSKVQ